MTHDLKLEQRIKHACSLYLHYRLAITVCWSLLPRDYYYYYYYYYYDYYGCRKHSIF